ncbi:MAG: tetratricopeptide repeat protein [Sedimentisphaerales bacterium]
MSTNTNQKQFLLLISTTLVAATLIAYEPMRHNDFVGYDDPAYIMENSNVTGGITPTSIVWAFSKSHAGNWHPLTWLSHTLDCELYGLKPLGHHITNLLFHIANTLLLFWLLQKMTGALWKSAFVAAAFALHPVHVESVAWAAERKDVLSGLFWMLTMLAYVHYVKKPDIKSYMLVILAFMMGLMSKPMVVTLPFVLLLLDYWPLDRFQNFKASFFKLVYEKIPLFALSAASCVITFAAQQHDQAVVSLSRWPLHIRIVNAIGSYFNYAVKIIYPKDLAVLYPLPDKITADAALMAITGIAILLIAFGRGRRWLAVGLFWYLGTLVPVLGLVQTGMQIMADRYTYLPSIGLFIIMAWGAEEILSKARYSRIISASGATAALIVIILLTRIQAGYWRDSGTLYKHTLAVTKNNFIISGNYGYYLATQGKYEEGMKHLMEAHRIRPNDMFVRENICVVLLDQNKNDEAIKYLTETLQKANNWPETYKLYCGLGLAYERKGELSAAQTNYKKALELKPDYTPAQNGLASVLAKQKQGTDDRTRKTE